MVKIVSALMAACALSSCVCAPSHRSPGAGMRTPLDVEKDAVIEEIIENPDLLELEFECIERLRENPIDPVGASREELLAIPGFPDDLARRVVAEAGERRAARRWIERLTPPERFELYRFREFLLLPKERPMRLRVRFTQEATGERTASREEGYLSFNAGGWKALWRKRRTEEGGGSACYLSGSALSGAVRIHAGTFVPDFALGLVFGGSRTYVFSPAYPFHKPRWVAGSTSFSAPSVQGAAGEFWRGNLHGALFAGRSRRYRSDRFELDEGELYGGRIALRLGSGEYGIAGFAGAFTPGSAVLSIDGRWRSGPIEVGFELASRGEEEPSVVSALSCRVAGARCALLLHAIPSGMAGRFCGVTGGAFDGVSAHNGIAVVVERESLYHVLLRAAIDRSRTADGIEGTWKRVARAELERRWQRAFVRLSWSSSIGEEGDVIPYPWGAFPSTDRANSIGFLSNLSLAGGADLRFALRHMAKNGSAGILIAPVLSTSLFHGHLRAAVSYASSRSLRGNPICWFYEPSLKGGYPWRAASGDMRAYAFLISYIINGLTVSSKVSLKSGVVPDYSFQALFEY